MKILVIGYSEILRRKSYEVLRKYSHDISIVSAADAAVISNTLDGVKRVYTQLKDITNFDYDFAYVCCDPRKHHDILSELKNLNVHTIVEKPISPSTTIRDILNQWPKDKLLSETFQFRFGKRIEKIKQLTAGEQQTIVQATFALPKFSDGSNFRYEQGALSDVGRYIMKLGLEIFLEGTVDAVTHQELRNKSGPAQGGLLMMSSQDVIYTGSYLFNSSYENKVVLYSCDKKYEFTRVFANAPTDTGSGITSFNAFGAQQEHIEIQEDTFGAYFSYIFENYAKSNTLVREREMILRMTDLEDVIHDPV